jgi:transposase
MFRRQPKARALGLVSAPHQESSLVASSRWRRRTGAVTAQYKVILFSISLQKRSNLCDQPFSGSLDRSQLSRFSTFGLLRL